MNFKAHVDGLMGDTRSQQTTFDLRTSGGGMVQPYIF